MHLVSVVGISMGWACSSSKDASSGSTADGGSDGATGGAVESACTAYAAAWCGRWEACAPPGWKTRYATIEACRTGETTDCAWRTRASGTGWSAESRLACAKAVEKEACEDFIDQKVVAACNHVGTLADGAACADDMQCLSGVCPTAFGAFCGTCQAGPTEGQPCVEGRCATGLYCRTVPGSGNQRLCRVPVGKDEACDATKPCLNSWSCTGGSCVARAELNQACDTEGTIAPFCASAHELDCTLVGATQKCTPFVYAGTGESCLSDSTLCGASGTCTAGGSGATCIAPAGEGAACSLTPDCAAPLACSARTCAAPDAQLCP